MKRFIAVALLVSWVVAVLFAPLIGVTLLSLGAAALILRRSGESSSQIAATMTGT